MITTSINATLKQRQDTDMTDNVMPEEAVPVQQSLTIPRLPFSFAKRFGIVLDKRPAGFVAAHKEGLLPHVLLEVQRFLGDSFTL